MIRIVDYGVGNIQAFLNVFKRIGFDAQRANTPEQLIDATHLILPGVGHFDHAMIRLNHSGLLPRLEELVLQSNIPVMGICVGMQMLSNGSDEGKMPGLGWLPGRVRSFAGNTSCIELAMPHMGWNTLKPQENSMLFSRGFERDPEFYFLHSYYFEAENRNNVAATATYGFEFDAAVSNGHIFGVQCHPEKSHHWGEQLLKNFIEL